MQRLFIYTRTRYTKKVWYTRIYTSVGTPMPDDDDDDDDDDDNVPAAVVAGSIVAVIALCSVLLLIFVITVTIIARTYKLKARHVTVDG